MTKPRLAIAGLTACSGCQLTLLNCETELPELAERFDFGYFPMGFSHHEAEGQFDAALVEGSVSTPDDLDMLMKLRVRSKLLIAFGTCAVWGGIAAMNNHGSRIELLRKVYGNIVDPDCSSPPAPLRRFVRVDFTITGCPPEKSELLATLASLLQGTTPMLPEYPVCTECRIRENLCLLIERGQLCLGPVIRAGCNARCPAVSIPCEGCRGPVVEANVAEELALLAEKGYAKEEIFSRLRRFCPEWNHGQRY